MKTQRTGVEEKEVLLTDGELEEIVTALTVRRKFLVSIDRGHVIPEVASALEYKLFNCEGALETIRLALVPTSNS